MFNMILSDNLLKGETTNSILAYLNSTNYPRLRLLLESNVIDFLNLLFLTLNSDSIFALSNEVW